MGNEDKIAEDKIAAEKIETEAKEEADLDKALQESIESVKDGNELAPEVKAPEETIIPPTGPTGSVETEPAPDISTGPTGPDITGPTGSGETGATGYEFRIPNKGKFESDESFEKRVHLLDLVKKRKLATTPEQKQLLSEEIKTAKSQIKNLNGSDRFTNQLNEKTVDGEPKTELTDEEKFLEADKERLKQLGGATKEDIQEVVQQERLAADIKDTVSAFVERYTELKDDEDVREVFFDFVDANYNWRGKGGTELMTVLELARENMFKPSESIQERVLTGAGVQDKVNAMQFPGGTVAKTEYSPEKRKSIDELVATGMLEEKAVELISDDDE